MKRITQIGLATIVLSMFNVFGSLAFADFVEDYRTNTDVGVAFGNWTDNFEFTAEGLVFDIPIAQTGAMTITASAPIELTGLTSIDVTARMDAGNRSTLVFYFDEVVSGERYVYELPPSDFVEGEFVTVSVDVADNLGVIFLDDGIPNGNLRLTGFSSPFMGTEPKAFTVESMRFVFAVPEPSSATILLLCSMLMLRRKRQQ